MRQYTAKGPTPIKITIDGGFKEDNKLELTISPDSTIEDWIDVFKTILIHQTFSANTVRDVFEPYQDEDSIPTSQSVWKEEF
jgi:hypothetical protein